MISLIPDILLAIVIILSIECIILFARLMIEW